MTGAMHAYTTLLKTEESQEQTQHTRSQTKLFSCVVRVYLNGHTYIRTQQECVVAPKNVICRCYVVVAVLRFCLLYQKPSSIIDGIYTMLGAIEEKHC